MKLNRVLVAVIVALTCVALWGCRTPLQRETGQALHDPNSDLVALQAQIAASKANQVNIAENLSQLQDDGWAYWIKEKVIARLPDDQPFMLELPNGIKAPVYNEYESLGKWNLVNTMTGVGESIGSLDSLDFTSGEWKQVCGDGTCDIKHYATGRDGFRFSLKGSKGNIEADASTIKAKYDGQVAVKTALAAGLGKIVEQHWAGRANMLKVGTDGTVTIINAGKEVVGEFLKVTPLGAAANGLEQIAVTIRESKTKTEQTEVLTQPADVPAAAN